MDTARTSYDDLKPSAEIRDTATQDGAVLLDIDQGLCFSMNPVGARIWEMLKSNHSIDSIADILSAECSVPREQVLTDVLAFVTELEKQHLLVSGGNKRKGKKRPLSALFRRIHVPKRSI